MAIRQAYSRAGGEEMTNEDKKQCHTCGDRKSIKDFYHDKRAKDGLYSSCKLCSNKRSINYSKTHPEKISAIHTKSQSKYYLKNKKKIALYAHTQQINNREKFNLAAKEWRMKSPDKIKAIRSRSGKKRRSTPKGKLRLNISTAIWQSIKQFKNNRKWESLVGYTVNDLKQHLENKFSDGMNWENYGKSGWHIDHIIPISIFNYEKPEDLDFKRCWGLSNLQPMWATDNIKKKDKIYSPFQPSLCI